MPVLGGLAEFERELIRARTGEGRKRAQERRVRFGRSRKLTPFQRKEALARLECRRDASRHRADVWRGRYDDREIGLTDVGNAGHVGR